jgi:hypothetical protein
MVLLSAFSTPITSRITPVAAPPDIPVFIFKKGEVIVPDRTIMTLVVIELAIIVIDAASTVPDTSNTGPVVASTVSVLNSELRTEFAAVEIIVPVELGALMVALVIVIVPAKDMIPLVDDPALIDRLGRYALHPEGMLIRYVVAALAVIDNAFALIVPPDNMLIMLPVVNSILSDEKSILTVPLLLTVIAPPVDSPPLIDNDGANRVPSEILII